MRYIQALLIILNTAIQILCVLVYRARHPQPPRPAIDAGTYELRSSGLEVYDAQRLPVRVEPVVLRVRVVDPYAASAHFADLNDLAKHFDTLLFGVTRCAAASVALKSVSDTRELRDAVQQAIDFRLPELLQGSGLGLIATTVGKPAVVMS